MNIPEKLKDHIREELADRVVEYGIVEAEGDWCEGDDYYQWSAEGYATYVRDYIGFAEVGYHDESNYEISEFEALIEKVDDDGNVVESAIWRE